MGESSMIDNRYTALQAITDLEAIAKRQQGGGISEDDHVDADRILLRLIGNDRITRAFDEIGKWYS